MSKLYGNHCSATSSVTVPLSHDRVWSSQKSKFTGRSHRAVFDNSLHEIYKDLYNKAKNAQT